MIAKHIHRPAAGLAALALLAGAPGAAADGVAPFGRCAEAAARSVSPDPDPDYRVAGAPADRFPAGPVASAPAPSTPGPAIPGARGRTPSRVVGPCESGGSGCAAGTAAGSTARPGPQTGFPFVPPP